MKHRLIVFLMITCFAAAAQKKVEAPLNDRKIWLANLDKVCRPVLYNLANDNLKHAMPTAMSKRIDNPESRKAVSYLEAFGRTLSGIAPWLNLEGGADAELALRKQYREWALKGISNAVNPTAKDFMDFKTGQSLVDASFLAYSFLRCPWLWEHLADSTKLQLADAFRSTKNIKPPFTNWILFAGMIEAFFCQYNLQWDPVRIEYSIHQFEQWYVGDGVYADGPPYHWDYYNSYVIHPYLNTIIAVVNNKNGAYKWIVDKQKERSERYAIIQERLINTDGTYPATGRSIVYRGAAFHHLADMAWRKKLPEQLHPAQVRCALTAVIKKTMESPSTFDKDGWLTIGLYGYQPDMADFYNTTGSLYICTNILLPLGLPETDEFWTAPAEKWTSQKIWSGEDVRSDHSIDK